MKCRGDIGSGDCSVSLPLNRGSTIKQLKCASNAAATFFASCAAGRTAISFFSWLAASYIVNPTRTKITSTPADYGTAYEEVTVTTADGLELVGWYMPGDNRAAIIAQHGYKGNRESMLYEAVVLNRHGYSILITTSRGHDESDGRHITFGSHEMKDLEAWHAHLLSREEVDPDAIGIMGESMGGGMAILYAAQVQNIKAVVTSSAFSLTDETIQDFLFQPFCRPGRLAQSIALSIVGWVEKKAGFHSNDINTLHAIGKISPRPILIIQGGNDERISPNNGHQLFAAARQPKELYFIPNGNHCDHQDVEPTKYMERVVKFLDHSFNWPGQAQVEIAR
jgi:fermentation-respiration switch protein FrsA (DUF1100 family)